MCKSWLKEIAVGGRKKTEADDSADEKERETEGESSAGMQTKYTGQIKTCSQYRARCNIAVKKKA